MKNTTFENYKICEQILFQYEISLFHIETYLKQNLFHIVVDHIFTNIFGTNRVFTKITKIPPCTINVRKFRKIPYKCNIKVKCWVYVIFSLWKKPKSIHTRP